MGYRPNNQTLHYEKRIKDGSRSHPWPQRFAGGNAEKHRTHNRSEIDMKSVLYPARIWHDGDVFQVQFLDMENAFTFGDTLENAKEMATDVLSAMLISSIEHGETVPEPVARKGKDIYLIAPDARVQAALLLRSVRGEKPQSDVAQSMGTTWQAYQKIEQPTSNTTLSKLQKAARALGKELVIEFR